MRTAPHTAYQRRRRRHDGYGRWVSDQTNLSWFLPRYSVHSVLVWCSLSYSASETLPWLLQEEETTLSPSPLSPSPSLQVYIHYAHSSRSATIHTIRREPASIPEGGQSPYRIDPREIVANIRRLMNGLEPTPMVSCSSLWSDIKLCYSHTSQDSAC